MLLIGNIINIYHDNHYVITLCLCCLFRTLVTALYLPNLGRYAEQ